MNGPYGKHRIVCEKCGEIGIVCCDERCWTGCGNSQRKSDPPCAFHKRPLCWKCCHGKKPQKAGSTKEA